MRTLGRMRGSEGICVFEKTTCFPFACQPAARYFPEKESTQSSPGLCPGPPFAPPEITGYIRRGSGDGLCNCAGRYALACRKLIIRWGFRGAPGFVQLLGRVVMTQGVREAIPYALKDLPPCGGTLQSGFSCPFGAIHLQVSFAKQMTDEGF